MFGEGQKFRKSWQCRWSQNHQYVCLKDPTYCKVGIQINWQSAIENFSILRSVIANESLLRRNDLLTCCTVRTCTTPHWFTCLTDGKIQSLLAHKAISRTFLNYGANVANNNGAKQIIDSSSNEVNNETECAKGDANKIKMEP